MKAAGVLAAMLTASVLCPAGAVGRVVDSSPHGFTSRNEVTIAATPDSIYHALVQDVGRWWNPDHTFSGDASNLRIEAVPGGCFCERLDEFGGVRHLEVVYAAPGKLLRMSGGLGPLQTMAVTGSMTWQLEPDADGGTKVAVVYVVSGYAPNGLEEWAAPVDGVVGEQLERLKAYVEGT